MSEKDKFDLLLSKDPTPGIKNRVLKEGQNYLVPGWVFDSKEDYVKVALKSRFPEKYGLTRQIIYDILVLGLTNFNDRPSCPICGDPCKYWCFSKGYKTTCGKETCIKESFKRKMTDLWKDQDYKERQSTSHKVWAEKEKNKEKLRASSLKAWENEDYRRRQTESHKSWASIDENKEKMSNITKEMWKNEEYRNKQSSAHKNWALNNPNKVFCGRHGTISSIKSNSGEISYDSTWEEDFIEFCNTLDSVISIERSDLHIPYTFNGEIRYYFPDFIIVTENETLLVEIKSDWMLESDERTKLKIDSGRAFVKESQNYSRYLVYYKKD